MKPFEQDTLHKSTADGKLLVVMYFDGCLSQDVAQLRADFQEMLQVKEEQEDVLHRRERELSALKGAFKEEVETHDKYIAALKDEYEQELENLIRDLERAKEVKTQILLISPYFQKLKHALFCLLCASFIIPPCLLGQCSAGPREG